MKYFLLLIFIFTLKIASTQELSSSQKAQISELMQDAQEAESDKNTAKAADKYTEIATIYSNISLSKAEEYYNEAFRLSKTSYEKMSLKNLIGSLYENKKHYAEAAKLYQEALVYAKETENEEKYVLNTYKSIGDMFQKAKQYRTAISYYLEGLKICIKFKNKKTASDILRHISNCYLQNGENQSASKCSGLMDETLEKINKEIFGKQSNPENSAELSNLRFVISKIGDENKGLKDSLLSQINDIEQLQNQTRSLSDTLNSQQRALSLVQKNLSDKSEQLTKVETYLQQRNFALTAAIAIISIITLLAILTLRGYFIQRKQNKLLAEQKKIINLKNEDMTASIRYAERIQKALFMPITDFNRIFPESFIIFKPRDIVSGDFYWFGELDDKIIVVAADCTGHGIPGAFMSVLGITYFDEIVNKSKISQTDTIVNLLRNSIIKGFHVSDQTVQAKDGMDLSLIVLEKKTMKLQYTGAYNPLLIIRQGEVLIFKADRMPVGFHDKYTNPFTKTEIDVQKDDVVYLFSDGYLDQFGGLHGKKFLFKRLQEVLQKIYHKPMEDQKEIIENAFKQWQGKYEQVDDVLLMGFRI